MSFFVYFAYFAQESTIRKLRQLLSQKTGESSSTESFKMHSQPVKPDEIAIPSDGRLFVNIRIAEMETVQVLTCHIEINRYSQNNWSKFF